MVTKAIYQKILNQMVEMAKFHHRQALSMNRTMISLHIPALIHAIEYHRKKRNAFMKCARDYKRAWKK